MELVLRMLQDNFLLYFSPSPSETITFYVLRWSPSLLKRTIPSWRNFKCSAGHYLFRHVYFHSAPVPMVVDLSTQASFKHYLSTVPLLLLQKSKNSLYGLTAYQEPKLSWAFFYVHYLILSAQQLGKIARRENWGLERQSHLFVVALLGNSKIEG